MFWGVQKVVVSVCGFTEEGAFQFIICDPTRDLVPLGGNVYFLVDELDFRVVKTICKYSC